MNIFRIKIRATSILELLVVIIISGILFLFLFEGLEILQKINHKSKTLIFERTNLMLSHQLMEGIMEQTDSIKKEEDYLKVFSNNGIYLIKPQPNNIVYITNGKSDTIFENLLKFNFHQNDFNSHIDTLLISIIENKDTIVLEYSTSENLIKNY